MAVREATPSASRSLRPCYISGRREVATMMAFFGSLAVIPWILYAQASWMMDAVPSVSSGSVQEFQAALEIRDSGEILGAKTVQGVRQAQRDFDRRSRVPVLVETVRTLDRAWIADVAQRRARAFESDRLYILLAGDEREVGVVGARRGPASRLTDQQRETIRRAFLEPLQIGKPDEAVERGVREIDAAFSRIMPMVMPGIRVILILGVYLVAAIALLIATRTWKRDGCGGGIDVPPENGRLSMEARASWLQPLLDSTRREK